MIKLLSIPFDSVRVSPDSLAALRDTAIAELDALRADEWQIVGQHTVTSADGTTVWIVILLEK